MHSVRMFGAHFQLLYRRVAPSFTSRKWKCLSPWILRNTATFKKQNKTNPHVANVMAQCISLLLVAQWFLKNLAVFLCLWPFVFIFLWIAFSCSLFIFLLQCSPLKNLDWSIWLSINLSPLIGWSVSWLAQAGQMEVMSFPPIMAARTYLCVRRAELPCGPLASLLVLGLFSRSLR